MTDLIVTGITGFLGRHIVDEALARGMYNHIYGISRRWVDQEQLSRKWGNRVTMINGDIRDRQALNDLFSLPHNNFDIIHAAAYKHVSMAQRNANECKSVNIDGTQVLLDVCNFYGNTKGSTRNIVFISTDKACVDYHGRVEIGGGGRSPIHKLVSDKYSEKVKTLDPKTGEFSEANVINWYKNKLDGREMIAVSYEKSLKHMKYTKRAIVTEDHPVLTFCQDTGGYEWVPAGELTEKTLLATGEPACNKKQLSLLVGTMLGDAYINKKASNNASHSLCLGQCEEQEEWLEIKRAALSGFEFGKKSVTKRRGNTFYKYETKRSNFFSDMEKEFYIRGEDGRAKIVPRNLVFKAINEGLPVFLAAWFLDDGCLSKNKTGRHNARIATHGFQEKDVVWLAEILSGLGFDCSAYKITWYKKPYWELRFTVSGTEKLIDLISPGIPPPMRESKIGGMPAKDFDSRFWDLGSAEPYLSYARTERVIQEKRDVYCIDVEDTHNFVVSNIILHNCAPVNVYGQSKAIAEQMVLNAGGTVLRFGNVWGSTGSLIEKWHTEMKRDNPVLEITEPTMTRYFYPIEDAVDYVLMATDFSNCKIIPNLKSTDIMSLANAYQVAYGKSAEIKIIGIRPGEKLHEQMTCPEELSMSSTDIIQDSYLRFVRGTFGDIPDNFGGLLGSDKAERFTEDELVELITKGL